MENNNGMPVPPTLHVGKKKIPVYIFYKEGLKSKFVINEYIHLNIKVDIRLQEIGMYSEEIEYSNHFKNTVAFGKYVGNDFELQVYDSNNTLKAIINNIDQLELMLK